MKPYYQDEWVTLYNADCRELLPTFPDKSFDLCLTDPPYPNGEGYFDDSISVASDFIRQYKKELLCFWSEVEKPQSNLPLVAVHIWHRTNVNGKIYEPIYHFHPDGKKRRSEIFSSSAVIPNAVAGCLEYSGHPTQKSTFIMSWLIKKTSGAIIDPFAGSGTTGVAAKKLKRKYTLIETEEKYCEIAAKRLNSPIPLFEQPEQLELT